MLISTEIYPFQSSVLQLTPACKALIAGASLEAGLARRPGRDLAAFWRALCFIRGQEVPVGAVLPGSGLPAGRRADRWAAGGQQGPTAHSWVSWSIPKLKDRLITQQWIITRHCRSHLGVCFISCCSHSNPHCCITEGEKCANVSLFNRWLGKKKKQKKQEGLALVLRMLHMAELEHMVTFNHLCQA